MKESEITNSKINEHNGRDTTQSNLSEIKNNENSLQKKGVNLFKLIKGNYLFYIGSNTTFLNIQMHI